MYQSMQSSYGTLEHNVGFASYASSTMEIETSMGGEDDPWEVTSKMVGSHRPGGLYGKLYD